jgi:hypothetical protein
MGIDLADYRNQTKEAIRAFWESREAARLKQVEGERTDQGERAGVTAGKNMDGFIALAKDIVMRNGLIHAEICLERRVLTLPGYFRPTKQWDILVMNKKRLIAALEFKSQAGPSFGNNFNNRTEEAIGTSVDLWTAFREGGFGESPRPFVGWLMLLEDCEGSRTPVQDNSPHFKVFPEFREASYAERYNLLCSKLMQENLYTAATLLLSPRSSLHTGEYSELSELTSLKMFVTTFAGHIAAEAAR